MTLTPTVNHRNFLERFISEKKFSNKFAPFLLWLIVFGVCLASFNRWGLSVALALAWVGVHSTLRVKRAVPFLRIAREMPTQSIENHEVAITYRVKNLSDQNLTHLLLEDRLDFTAKKWIVVAIPYLKKRSSLEIKVKVLCDNGMGEFLVQKPLLKFSDVFDLIEYEVTNDLVDTIEILPRVEWIPGVRLEGTPSSPFYGDRNLPLPQLSVQFMGIREFGFGDSLRHISWRKSAKHQKLLVKEFEKAVNAIVHLFYDAHLLSHAMAPGASSFEVQKDLVLSLCSEFLGSGNCVYLHSQTIKGLKLLGLNSLSLAKIAVMKDPAELEVRLDSILRAQMPLFTSGSTVVFVISKLTPDLSFLLDNASKTHALGHSVHIYLLDPAQMLGEHLDPILRTSSSKVLGLPEYARLFQQGIPVTEIARAKDWPRDLLSPRNTG